MDGTEIDYPILYDTTYNRYYLTHNYAGTATPYGSIFFLGENEGDYSDFNTVVYGHNMIDGHMFAQLHRIKEQSFFDTHDQIIIYTPDRKLTYQVIAAVCGNNLYIIANNDFSTQELREQYIKSIYSNVDLGSDSRSACRWYRPVYLVFRKRTRFHVCCTQRKDDRICSAGADGRGACPHAIGRADARGHDGFRSRVWQRKPSLSVYAAAGAAGYRDWRGAAASPARSAASRSTASGTASTEAPAARAR